MKKSEPIKSILDLAFALLLVFILISAYFMKKNLENEFKNVPSQHINEKLLFESGKYSIVDTIQAEKEFHEAFNKIHEIVNKYREKGVASKIKNILIIGHTDTDSISSDLKIKYNDINYSNWNLSLDRANTIVQFIKRKGILDEFEEFSEVQLLPCGKAYYQPNYELVKKYYLEYEKNRTNQKVEENAIELLNYVYDNYSIEKIMKLISYCNSNEEYKMKNRRIEIRLDL